MSHGRTIQVRCTSSGDPLVFEAVVRESGTQTSHRVNLAKSDCDRLGGRAQKPEQLVEAAFRFLLDREPKESILRHFDLSKISRYFPEFERELPRYLGGPPSRG